jgi:beta-lactamase class D
MGKKMKFIHVIPNLLIIAILSLFTNVCSYAEDPDLARLFLTPGVEGTLIIDSLDGKKTYVYNEARSQERFSPASTFKILNTLIALEEGAIKNEKEVIKWDGKKRGLEAWNKDQTLETAFPVSCVWFYQELARRIGNEKYITHLKKIEYGNQKAGPEVTTFWLNGELKISTKEQIDFLKRLYEEKIPYERSHIQTLKKIMIAEENPQYTIRAKTGTNSQLAWYVGYIETPPKVWFFAMNIEIKKKGDEAFRKEIIMEALKLKGII